MGLNIMCYRARALAGMLEIQSNSFAGTMVTCRIARAASDELSPDIGGKHDVARADRSGIAEGVQKHPEFKIANSGACE